jgi:CHAD domain-containing protein
VSDDPTIPGTGPAALAEEIELKFRVLRPEAGERWLAAAGIGDLVPSAKRPKTLTLEDRYVDTLDGVCAAAGYAVRLRTGKGGTLVSVKGLDHLDGPGGSVRRTEVEGPADPATHPADWPDSPARSLVVDLVGAAALIERVAIRQVRRKRILDAPVGRAELSLDSVEVAHAGRVVGAWEELELELRSGEPVILVEAGAVLASDPDLVASPHSKLEAALEAVAAAETAGDAAGLVEPPVVLAGPLLSVGKTAGVTGDDHIAEAGRKVLRFHLARMLDVEPGTRDGDVVALHKMRVATRRQRAAWRVFGDAFRPNRTRRYRTGLKDIAARLGGVRDMDVLLEGADAYRADHPTVEQRALQPLLDGWRDQREVARRELARELDSHGYRRWLDDYVAFVQTEGAAVLPVGPVQPHRVRDTAPSRIWAAYEVVRGYEPVLRWADVETLHDLRIAGKWLRYTLEFVRDALGPDATPLIARVTALQDHLGLMHDADVAAGLARQFLVEHAGELSPLESSAIGRYLVDRERETMRLRRTIGPAWRGVAGLRFRRQLGRVVAGL